MSTITGYKMLRSDGTSLRKKGRVDYLVPSNGQPGPWVEVPGNGAYVAVEGGLAISGHGTVIVRMECDPESEVMPPDLPPCGVRCFRRVRVLEVVDQVTWPDGTRKWYREGLRHREDGPAVIWPDGQQEWWRKGKLHRDDGPAVIFADGGRQWYRDGRRHRDDGPAVVLITGYRSWWRDGLLHREGGPAAIFPDGTKEWYRNGLRHREDGPAVVWPSGKKEYWREGRRIK